MTAMKALDCGHPDTCLRENRCGWCADVARAAVLDVPRMEKAALMYEEVLNRAKDAEAAQAVLAEALDGLVNDSLVQQYHGVKAYERAQAALSPGAGDRVRELVEAARPFGSIWGVAVPLNPDPDDGIRDHLARVWPTIKQAKALYEALARFQSGAGR